jgi:hypothetical protein
MPFRPRWLGLPRHKGVKTMAVPTKLLKTWSTAQWQTAIKHAQPSGDGAVGVAFCWTRNPSSEGPDYKDLSSADFVIKPASDGVSSVKFGETFLKEAVDAISVNTLVIPHTDARFRLIKAQLQRAKDAAVASLNWHDTSQGIAEQANQQRALGLQSHPRYWQGVAVKTARYTVSDKVRKAADRWSSQWHHYDNAKAYLVQDMAQALVDFKEDYIRTDEGHGLQAMLKNAIFMRNLGRLFAADAVLGNGDRLCSLNTGNILFNAHTGQIYAIDTSALLTNYQRMTSNLGYNKADANDTTLEDWVKQIALPNHGAAISPTGGMGIATFAMNRLFDVDGWWDNVFEFSLRQSLDKRDILIAVNTWAQARTWFKLGVDEGLGEVDAKLSGLNWLLVKQKFQAYGKKFGDNPNLDWTNFKMRRLYVKAVLAEKQRLGNRELSPDETTAAQLKAFKLIGEYAKRKYGDQVI